VHKWYDKRARAMRNVRIVIQLNTAAVVVKQQRVTPLKLISPSSIAVHYSSDTVYYTVYVQRAARKKMSTKQTVLFLFANVLLPTEIKSFTFSL
jgi:hypothetical protein